MAGVTLSGRADVRSRLHLSILGKISAAMASGTVTCRDRSVRTRMAHHPRRKSNEAIYVTDIALRTGRNVRPWLAERIDTDVRPGVTGRALASEAGVVHFRRSECDKIRMTGIALLAGGNMG